jgi:hypothetical protein
MLVALNGVAGMGTLAHQPEALAQKEPRRWPGLHQTL